MSCGVLNCCSFYQSSLDHLLVCDTLGVLSLSAGRRVKMQPGRPFGAAGLWQGIRAGLGVLQDPCIYSDAIKSLC